MNRDAHLAAAERYLRDAERSALSSTGRATCEATIGLLHATLAAAALGRICQANAPSALRMGVFVDSHMHECVRESGHRSVVHRCDCGTEWHEATAGDAPGPLVAPVDGAPREAAVGSCVRAAESHVVAADMESYQPAPESRPTAATGGGNGHPRRSAELPSRAKASTDG